MRQYLRFFFISWLLLSFSSPIHAVLWDRGGGLIYDDILDVTWLQDADYARTDGSFIRRPSWQNAKEWAQNLEYYDSVRDVIWDDWRLPRISPVNGVSFDERLTGEPHVYDGSSDEAHNVSATGSAYPGSTASELAYMFYNNLGCLAWYDLKGNRRTGGVHGIQDPVFQTGVDGDPVFESGGPGGQLVSFYNIDRTSFWTNSDEGIASSLGVWAFNFQTGEQLVIGEGFENVAWAVRDGDVAAIDDPPNFNNASLPTSVTYPNKIYFSGNANDDNGLTQIMMAVDGPSGLHTIFTETITGTSLSLDRYFFDSTSTTYANQAGSYTITLKIIDTANQTYKLNFYTSVNIIDNVNNPPSKPTLISPYNGEAVQNYNQINFNWGNSEDPEGDSIEYILVINEFGQNDDFVIAIKTTETNHSANLNQDSIYSWFVFSVDENGNVGVQSESSFFSTKTSNTNLLIDFYGIGYDVNFFENESIYSIVRNCIDVDDYTYSKWHWVTIPNNLPFPNPLPDEIGYPKLHTVVDEHLKDVIKLNASTNNNPMFYVDGREQITPWLDGSWGNSISSDNRFNTVFSVDKVTLQEQIYDRNIPFEVISFVDEAGPRFIGTDNFNSYFFSYTTQGDEPSSAVNLRSWIDFLESVKNHYETNIDTLTIFAHGSQGKVIMSDNFILDSALLSNEETLQDIHRLRDILSAHSTILIFSCNVGKGEIGNAFVKSLSNATNSTVYANSAKTGFPKKDSDNYSQDWDLDVIAVPDAFFDNPNATISTIPVSANHGRTIMLPGGVTIEIESNDLTSDGVIEIENVTNSFSEDELVIGAYDISLGPGIVDDESITITLPYNFELVNSNNNDLTVKFWDEVNSKWSDSGIWDIVVSDGFIIFKTNHTTIFGILDDAKYRTLSDSSGGGGCFISSHR